jgi:hypothetical protein
VTGSVHRSPFWGGALALAASTLSTAAVANIFAADGRDPRHFVAPGTAEARLFLPVGSVTGDFTLRNLRAPGGVNSGEGTAFMVSPCDALTAYHVLFGSGALSLNPMGIYPVTLRFGGDASSRPALLVKGRVRFWGSTDRAGPDVALILLDGCPGKQIGWLDLAAPDPAIEVTRVAMPGYAHDRSMRRLSLQSDCRIHTALRARGWLLHDCASREGASGAPLLAQRGDRYVVVGINAGEFDAQAEVQPGFPVARANWAIGTAVLRATTRLSAMIVRDQRRAGVTNPLDTPSSGSGS